MPLMIRDYRLPPGDPHGDPSRNLIADGLVWYEDLGHDLYSAWQMSGKLSYGRVQLAVALWKYTGSSAYSSHEPHAKA